MRPQWRGNKDRPTETKPLARVAPAIRIVMPTLSSGALPVGVGSGVGHGALGNAAVNFPG